MLKLVLAVSLAALCYGRHPANVMKDHLSGDTGVCTPGGVTCCNENFGPPPDMLPPPRRVCPNRFAPFYPACSTCCSGFTTDSCDTNPFREFCTCCAKVGVYCCNATYEICHRNAPAMPQCEDCCGRSYGGCETRFPPVPFCQCGALNRKEN